MVIDINAGFPLGYADARLASLLLTLRTRTKVERSIGAGQMEALRTLARSFRGRINRSKPKLG